MHVKKGDTVEVLTGDDAGTSRARTLGKVLRVLPDENKVVVEGVNKVYRHMKPSRRNPQGGRLSKEMPIHASNVLLYCPNCGRGRRIGKRYTADGAKERYCKGCNSGLGLLSKPNPKYVRPSTPA